MKSPRIFLSGSLLLALLIVGCTPAGTTPAANENQPAEAMTSTQEAALPTQEATRATLEPMQGTQEASQFDAQFIDSMIPHHQGAVAMAQMALTQAQHEELRQMAQNIVDSQQREIDQMQQWRQQWYPDLAPTGGMMSM